jgi:hypothetical protein
VESTINQLVAKRFVKKQQMRWTPRGAHLLLQIRVQALNDDLQTSFNVGIRSLDAHASRLEIDIGTPGDLFAEAVRRGSDLQIQNIRDPKIAARFPPYFTAAFPQTASFIVLPIVFWRLADRLHSGRTGRTGNGTDHSEDIGLLRAVRGQITLAMKTVR